MAAAKSGDVTVEVEEAWLNLYSVFKTVFGQEMPGLDSSFIHQASRPKKQRQQEMKLDTETRRSINLLRPVCHAWPWLCVLCALERGRRSPPLSHLVAACRLS